MVAPPAPDATARVVIARYPLAKNRASLGELPVMPETHAGYAATWCGGGEMEWNGTEVNGMEWNGNRMEWDRTGRDRMECAGRLLAVVKWNGMEQNGTEWNEMKWNTTERNGMDRAGRLWRLRNGMAWSGKEHNGTEWNEVTRRRDARRW